LAGSCEQDNESFSSTQDGKTEANVISQKGFCTAELTDSYIIKTFFSNVLLFQWTPVAGTVTI
jgi:hypothetical protein